MCLAKFKELSPILTVRGASQEGSIASACVQSVLIYGTDTWAMIYRRLMI